VSDGGTGGREKLDAIKDAVCENLLQLVNRNMITRSKMGDVVHEMQELSAIERTRIQDVIADGHYSNLWHWLAFMAVTAAVSGTIILGVRWWTKVYFVGSQTGRT
jgi:hypothetical protein